MASKGALFPSHTEADFNVRSSADNISSAEKIRWRSQCKHAVFESLAIPFSCHAFARVGLFLTWSFRLYHDDVHNKSQQRALSFKWSLVDNLNTYESTNGFNTVLNIQERGNLLTNKQNEHYRFLKMPQTRSETLAVQLSSWLKLWHVLSWSPSLCSVLCDLTAAAEFSLKEVNAAEGWRGNIASNRGNKLFSIYYSR